MVSLLEESADKLSRTDNVASWEDLEIPEETCLPSTLFDILVILQRFSISE
jgi:hypothetical protein